jgi:hypothetical protein
MIMQRATTALILVAIFWIAFIPARTWSGDLDDDGIGIDDKVKSYEDLGQPEANVKYLIRSARAQAARATGPAVESQDAGDVVVGGFINETGADVGDVTIIFDGEDITAISDGK